jgi:hypothetical protein
MYKKVWGQSTLTTFWFMEIWSGFVFIPLAPGIGVVCSSYREISTLKTGHLYCLVPLSATAKAINFSFTVTSI